MAAKERGKTLNHAATKFTKAISASILLGSMAGMMALINCGGTDTNSGTGTTTTGGATTGGACTSQGTPLSCDPNAGGLDPSAPELSDFNADAAAGTATWNASTGKWGVASNMLGSLFAYRGPKTTTTDWPDFKVADGALSDGGHVADYVGIGMSFDKCVNTAKFTGIKFTLKGNKGGCTLQFQVQTLEQQAESNKGLCDTCLNSCYVFPKVTIPDALDPSTPITITVPFSELESTGMPAAAADFEKQMIGFQWHLEAGTNGACDGVALSVDDVAFVQ